MISKEDLPGPLRALAAHARTAIKEGYVKPVKKIFDNAKVSDHFAIIPTLLAPKSLSEIEAKLYDMVAKRFLAVFFPSGRVHGDDAHLDRRQGRQGVPLPDQRQGDGQAGLARRLRPRGAGGRRQPRRRGRRRAGAHRERRRQGAEDPAAGALHRGDAAVGDGRRRQADRRRRAARGDAGEGPRHAGDAGRDHRGPDLREVHPPRGPRAGAGRQGVPADDAAARPRRRGPDQARAHRQLGVPAGRDGEGPPRARGLHAADRRDGRAHRAQGQGVRPRHHPRRLRDADDAVPELRRRRQGELPPLRLHRLARARPSPAASRSARSRAGGAFELAEVEALPARQADRAAGGLSLQGRLAVHRRDQAGARRGARATGSSSSTSARTPSARASPASRSTSRRRRASACARRRRARSTSSAPATSASTRSAPTSPATSRAAR